MFPGKQVTSAAFGGEDYDVLFVTTGADPSRFGEQPEDAGHLFKVTGLKMRGKAPHKVRI